MFRIDSNIANEMFILFKTYDIIFHLIGNAYITKLYIQ